MKTTGLLFRLCCLLFIIFSSCQKDDDLPEIKTFPENAKLKQILLYSSIDGEEPICIVEEYEYDEFNRIYKVSSPKYQDGIIVGVIEYDLYEYNTIGQLVKITIYHSNNNSPTGFFILSKSLYTYSRHGKKVKELIEYPQINSFEYLLFRYKNNRLDRIEKYDNTDELENYIVYEYNASGEILKETSYDKDNQPYSYTLHTYYKGLNIKSDVYAGKDMVHWREIKRTYDNHKLIILESTELSPVSSAMSYVWRYEYYED